MSFEKSADNIKTKNATIKSTIDNAEVTIPAEGGTATVTATSTKHWQFDTLPEDWATVTPNEGNEGDTTITIKIE